MCFSTDTTPGPSKNHHPSGWDKITVNATGTDSHGAETTLASNFDVQDIIYSSVDNWDNYGANAAQDQIVNDLDDAGITTTPRYGAFNIPVCYVHKSWGLDSFYDQLPWPDTTPHSHEYKNAG